MVGTGVYIYLYPNQKKPLLAIIFVVYILNNCLEGVTHLLIEKIIPSFVKFCGKNMKYLSGDDKQEYIALTIATNNAFPPTHKHSAPVGEGLAPPANK